MSPKQIKFVFRLLLALFFILAGIMHFLKPEFYVAIVPPFLPRPLALVDISGVCEIFGGIGLMIPGLRRLAGCGLILLLIAVFPANVYMLMKACHQAPLAPATLLLVMRLPLQFVFIQIVNVLSKYP